MNRHDPVKETDLLRPSSSLPDLGDGLPNPQRSFAFLTVAIAVTMAVLDGAIINVALPIIAADQKVTPDLAIWAITVYQLAVVVSLLPFSALGEAIGFRKVYLAGLALFAFSSLLCALAPDIVFLSAARVLQGLGGGALMSINGALIRHIMPLDRLGRGISGVSVTVGVAAAAGPSLAAAILTIASWHWLFLINIPLAIAVIVIGRLTLPDYKGSGHGFDFVSALLNTLTFGFLISALSSIGRHGTLLLVGGQLLIAIVAGFFLLRRQLSRVSPMFPIDLFRRSVFTLSVIASVSSFVAQFLALVSLPFYFHDVLGKSVGETGLLLTPWPAAIAVVAPFAGRMADRLPPSWMGAGGMLIFAVGLAGVGFLPASAGNAAIMVALGVCGVGFGLFQAPNNRVMMISAPRNRAGGVSGAQSTARVLGQSVGAALASIVIGLSVSFDLHTLMTIGIGFALVSAIASFTRNPMVGLGNHRSSGG
jgi:DHA2 family multidrug resistance protein-like MFS transporter